MTLWDLPATDPNVRPADAPRLSRQNAAVLARLMRGPATNAELAGIALKYTSRVSDLRKAGFTVVENDGTYRLKEVQ